MYIEDGTAVIEAGGMGYEIACSSDTLSKIAEANGEVCLYTHLNVKQDELSLFGFLTREEKALFLRLIGISGVGPKTALQVLTAGNVLELISAGDTVTLSKVKGIGKKTAERIVLELKGLHFISGSSGFSGAAAVLGADAEAAEVLVSLGLSRQEALSRIGTHKKQGQSVEQLIESCLKN